MNANTSTETGTPETSTDGFAGSRERFETLVGFLDGAAAARLSHGELEASSTPRVASCCGSCSPIT